MFGKIKAKRPPKGYKKSVEKESFVPKQDGRNIFTETMDLSPGSMWIETGKMTGGSRNILDLSKNGNRDGIPKFGSLSFFGLDPDSTNSEKDINVLFGGKTYIGNHIFYTEGNSNWRIRLNGETADGEKITIFSKPTLGQNGGFQDKILIFTQIDDILYDLEILDKDELSKLKENSSDWANGGKGRTGRAYGVIKGELTHL